jgi:hypothetical protein
MSKQIPAGIATRLNYHDGMFLTSASMGLEQSYFSNWIKLQNRMLYTSGVLQGMKVQLDAGPAAALMVDPGAAFDDDGNFLILPGGPQRLLVPAGTPTPFAVFAVYNALQQADTVDQAAVLTIAPPELPPANSVILATAGFDNGTLIAPTDARIPVTTRLPAVLTDEFAADQLAGNIDAAKRGSIMADVSDLKKARATKTLQVYFHPQKIAVFSFPPLVHITVQGSIPFATAVSAIDTIGFQVTVTTVQAMGPDSAPVQLNWLAFSDH